MQRSGSDDSAKPWVPIGADYTAGHLTNPRQDYLLPDRYDPGCEIAAEIRDWDRESIPLHRRLDQIQPCGGLWIEPVDGIFPIPDVPQREHLALLQREDVGENGRRTGHLPCGDVRLDGGGLRRGRFRCWHYGAVAGAVIEATDVREGMGVNHTPGLAGPDVVSGGCQDASQNIAKTNQAFRMRGRPANTLSR